MIPKRAARGQWCSTSCVASHTRSPEALGRARQLMLSAITWRWSTRPISRGQRGSTRGSISGFYRRCSAASAWCLRWWGAGWATCCGKVCAGRGRSTYRHNTFQITQVTRWWGLGRLRLPEISLFGRLAGGQAARQPPKNGSWRDFVPPNLPKIADRVSRVIEGCLIDLLHCTIHRMVRKSSVEMQLVRPRLDTLPKKTYDFATNKPIANDIRLHRSRYAASRTFNALRPDRRCRRSPSAAGTRPAGAELWATAHERDRAGRTAEQLWA